jgi:flagellar basal-body rod modification protein FlgD
MSTIPAVTSALTQPPTAPATPSTTRSTGTDSLSDPNTFLQLLVAELKYQNPMNPADPNQYLAQTAQFSMVQKINDMDTQITSMLAASQQAAASSLIGRQIVGSTVTGTPVTGVVTGLQMASGGPLLVVGTQTVPMGNVTSVSSAGSGGAPAAAAPVTTPSPAATPATSPAPTTPASDPTTPAAPSVSPTLPA